MMGKIATSLLLPMSLFPRVFLKWVALSSNLSFRLQLVAVLSFKIKCEALGSASEFFIDMEQ